MQKCMVLSLSNYGFFGGVMNDFQAKLLEIFKWLTKFLDKNNIKYYAIGGTMLGAVRHNGFIPWDDDIDIAVPRKDYNRLIELFNKKIDHYILECPNTNDGDYCYNYAKVYDTDTTLIERAKKRIIRGVYIDIFPLDGIGNSYEEALANYKTIDKKNMLLTTKMSGYRKGRKWWKNLASLLGYVLPVNCKKMAIKIDSLCSKLDFDDCLFVGNLVSTYRSREIMEKRVFGKPTAYSFEGLTIYGPENYDEYLSILFGDWQKLPPPEKRVSAHNNVYLDLNTPWLSYGKGN